MFEIDGVTFQFWAWAEDRKVRYLEILSLGLVTWDGSEAQWSFVEPEPVAPAS
jgi:hypothetical protein